MSYTPLRVQSVAPPERGHFCSYSSSLVLALTGLTQLAQRHNF
ncbi:MAG: hypothetical protein V7L31_29445 [Nostoc sp.]